jgi:D-alanyl-D-alanine carboxypeptidase/D-alanyl-D-alanine-endopeptidase (penicillin-binding protein 4)
MRVAATVLLVAGTACILDVVRVGTTAQAAPESSADPPAGLATPLLSPRRLPVYFDNLFGDMVAANQLQKTVDAFFAHDDACIAIDRNGQVLAQHNPTQSFLPASTQKLLTGVAALAVFGADHRFVTRAVTSAPIRNGVVQGDVYVIGDGDPTLSTPQYAQELHGDIVTRNEPVAPINDLVDAIARAGVHGIDGAVIGDDSHHDRLRFLPVWKPLYRTEGDIGSLSALGLDHGFSPTGDNAAPDDPAAAAAGVIGSMLTARGITVEGSRSGTAPAGAREIARMESPPLGAIVTAMLTSSDNWAAEILARDIGRQVAHQGTTAAGTAAITRVLSSLGVSTAGIHLVDGSGLARDDRVTCSALLGAINLSATPRFSAINEGLAVAGESGTLATRLGSDPLRGVLRAKTGHIDGVAALAGVIDRSQPLRFAFVVNGQFSVAQGEALQDAAARLVATYPQVPTSSVVPAPGP